MPGSSPGMTNCVCVHINLNQAIYFSRRDWTFRGQTNEVICPSGSTRNASGRKQPERQYEFHIFRRRPGQESAANASRDP
jgi:hypothetical protein